MNGSDHKQMKKIVKFFQGVKKEIRRVRWPQKKEMFKYSIATIVFVCLFTVFFYIFDILVALITKWVG